MRYLILVTKPNVHTECLVGGDSLKLLKLKASEQRDDP